MYYSQLNKGKYVVIIIKTFTDSNQNDCFFSLICILMIIRAAVLFSVYLVFSRNIEKLSTGHFQTFMPQYHNHPPKDDNGKRKCTVSFSANQPLRLREEVLWLIDSYIFVSRSYLTIHLHDIKLIVGNTNEMKSEEQTLFWIYWVFNSSYTENLMMMFAELTTL